MDKKTLIPPSEEKLGKIADLVRDAIRKRSGISDRGAQMLIEKGGEFQEELIPIVRRMAGENNPYASEQTRIAYFYPKGYVFPAVADQVSRLSSAFPDLNFTGAEKMAKQVAIPEGADGPRVIVKLSALARIFCVADPYGSGYGQLVQKVLDVIGRTRKFCNYREGELNEKYIRLFDEARMLLEKLEAADQNDFLILAVNFGDWKTGFTYSPRNARWQALNINQQLPLGAAQIGSMLIADPDRLSDNDHLFIDCPVDEYNWYAGGKWSYCPYFLFGDDELRFHADDASYVFGRYGSAVAFLGVSELGI